MMKIWMAHELNSKSIPVEYLGLIDPISFGTHITGGPYRMTVDLSKTQHVFWANKSPTGKIDTPTIIGDIPMPNESIAFTGRPEAGRVNKQSIMKSHLDVVPAVTIMESDALSQGVILGRQR